MIIDTHLHTGSFGPFALKEDLLLSQMSENNIGKGLVSTVSCCEFMPDSDTPHGRQMPQLLANAELLAFLEQHPGMLYGAFWCKPYTERNTREVEAFLIQNRKFFKALKLHPFYSRLPLNDPRYLPYLETARNLKLPVCVHTAQDELCSPRMLAELARRHPDIDFVMVHLGLMSDHEEGISCVAELPNLYGDTTWVPFETVQKAILRCGAHKILFGSDAPVDADNSYGYYREILAAIKESRPGFTQLAQENPIRLFRI